MRGHFHRQGQDTRHPGLGHPGDGQGRGGDVEQHPLTQDGGGKADISALLQGRGGGSHLFIPPILHVSLRICFP